MELLQSLSNEVEAYRQKLTPRDLKILELYKEKKQFVEIAKELSVTKGVIAGVVFRARNRGLLEGYPVDPDRAKSNAGRPRRKPRRETAMPLIVKRMLGNKAAAEAAVLQKPKRIRLTLIESPTAVTFKELEPHHCKWPQGDPKRPDFRFCGCQRQANSPYCMEHTVAAAPPSHYRNR